MRWMEKCYAKVMASFRSELEVHGLAPEEIEICLGLAAQDVTGGDLFQGLTP